MGSDTRKCPERNCGSYDLKEEINYWGNKVLVCQDCGREIEPKEEKKEDRP